MLHRAAFLDGCGRIRVMPDKPSKRKVVLVCPSPTTRGCEGEITLYVKNGQAWCACGLRMVPR